jgi:hypothetical protein
MFTLSSVFATAQQVLTLNIYDAIGIWESAIGNNEFIGLDIYRYADDGVAGHFKKYTKDSQGNIGTIFYNSETSEMLTSIDDPSLFLEPNRNTSLNTDLNFSITMLLIDRGISNQLSPSEREFNIHTNLYRLTLSKSCTNCPLQISWTKSRGNPGGIDVGVPKTQLPDTILFYKL